jgi:hypothetical protein
MTVGNSWTYLASYAMLPPDTIIYEITQQVHISVGSDTALAFARQSHVKGFDRSPAQWLFRKGIDGVYMIGGISPTDTLAAEFLWLKHPSRWGDAWRVPILLSLLRQ